MLRTAAISALVFALATGACTAASEEDDLKFEADGGKQDAARPLGRFEQTVLEGKAGFSLVALHEDHTFEGSGSLYSCDPGECTNDVSGTYRFASSSGKPYIVLYSGEDTWYSFEYKLAAEALSLRPTGRQEWFTLQRVASALALDKDDNGGSFDVVEGVEVVLRLPGNATTGFTWGVAATDRSFAYPEDSYYPAGGVTGSGGMYVFTWQTRSPQSLVGQHSVRLEYRRQTGVPATETFSFTVNVTAAP